MPFQPRHEVLFARADWPCCEGMGARRGGTVGPKRDAQAREMLGAGLRMMRWDPYAAYRGGDGSGTRLTEPGLPSKTSSFGVGR